MADGNITFSTALDNEGLEKGIKEAEREIDELKKKLEAKTAERNALVDEMKEAREEISRTEESIASLKQRLAELREKQPTAEEPQEAINARIKVVEEEIAKQEALLDRQLDKGVKLAENWNKADQEVAKYSEELEQATSRQSALAAEYQRVYASSNNVFSASMAAVESRFTAFANKITKRMKKLFVFSFIFAALGALKSYLVSSIKENERFSASVENLKAVLAGLATPVINVLIPALTSVVNVIAVILIHLARLVDMVFNTSFSQSIADAQAAAQSAAAASDATNDQADATRNLAKAQKEASKWLAAFDELNVIQAQDSEDNAEGLDGLGGAGGGTAPNWDALDIGKIDEKLAEIMLILGAALLAVGAILAFSGINIPLGITLMAIGALMIYSAAMEQWDKLPEEVRQAITGMLVITGIVLLAIGAVLALSGAAVPIGIGMMAAGALMLWAAVALNWESMPEEMQTVVSVLMGILGVALLVIGAVLAFSGGGTPLGIGLMLVGAASLAAAVAINWESMPEEIRSVVTTIGTIVGSALLVVGAILTFATPGGQALGVGLMLAGAMTLATVAMLNWDSMPQQIRDVVSTIAAIVGGAFIVMGIILIATGVALPLGVALLVAGAASLVTAVAVNWDAIKDKVIEVWNSLKAWFDSTVRPVFTVQFWADLFKSMINGLISMINYGLSAVGWFLDSIVGGISDILDFFGVEGWSFSISMPRISYLAEGAVIPPNRSFMAVLGDQSNGRNLEAPEGLIRQIVREEAGGNAQMLMLLQQILSAIQNGQTLECDGYTLAKVVNARNSSVARMLGT